MIPHDYLVAYAVANTFALAALALAFWRRDAARGVGAVVFAWAAATNTYWALAHPAVYLDYASLTPSATYRDFILGWFSSHVQALVLPIAVGQLLIAALLASRRRRLRSIGVLGALTFLLAIVPLGVGSGFPFPLTFGAALLVSQGAAVVRSDAARRILWWSPRLLGFGLSLFLSLFAFDVFGEGTNVLRTLRDFAIHLAPAGIVLAIVFLTWRHGRIGGALCFILAVAYGVLTGGRLSWMLAISAPLVVEGALFFWSAAIAGDSQVLPTARSES